MVEILLDEVEQACENLRDKLTKFKDYIRHLETMPVHKLTIRERELIKKFGKKRDTALCHRPQELAVLQKSDWH